MRYLIYTIGLFTVAVFATCKKPDLPKPVTPGECWQKFVGHYTVFDTAAGISYPLTIEHYKDTNAGGYYTDFFLFKNFDNQFNFSHQFTCFTPSNYIEFGFNTNIENHFGNHYNIWDQGDDPTTSKRENCLLKDTIYLYFNIENTAYWPSEGVPYVDVYKHQFAVKQH